MPQQKLGAQLATGQPNVPSYFGGSSISVPGANSASKEQDAVLSSLGMQIPALPHTGMHAGAGGLPGSSMNSLFAAGSLLGALARQSAWGTGFADRFGASHGSKLLRLGEPTQTGLFGVGSRGYGRGTPEQWVAAGKGTRGKGTGGTRWRRIVLKWVHGTSEVAAVGVGGIVGEMLWPPGGAVVGATVTFGVLYFADLVSGAAKEFDPWSGVLYGRRAEGVPTTTPWQSGRPTVSGFMQQALDESMKRMHEQAHSRRVAGSDGGGGTSIAPERLFLNGTKHPYDIVAMRRPG